jgi:hypothetical protein
LWSQLAAVGESKRKYHHSLTTAKVHFTHTLFKLPTRSLIHHRLITAQRRYVDECSLLLLATMMGMSEMTVRILLLQQQQREMTAWGV